MNTTASTINYLVQKTVKKDLNQIANEFHEFPLQELIRESIPNVEFRPRKNNENIVKIKPFLYKSSPTGSFGQATIFTEENTLISYPHNFFGGPSGLAYHTLMKTFSEKCFRTRHRRAARKMFGALFESANVSVLLEDSTSFMTEDGHYRTLPNFIMEYSLFKEVGTIRSKMQEFGVEVDFPIYGSRFSPKSVGL